MLRSLCVYVCVCAGDKRARQGRWWTNQRIKVVDYFAIGQGLQWSVRGSSNTRFLYDISYWIRFLCVVYGFVVCGLWLWLSTVTCDGCKESMGKMTGGLLDS